MQRNTNTSLALNQTFAKKLPSLVNKASRLRSNIPAPGSLKFGYNTTKKEDNKLSASVDLSGNPTKFVDAQQSTSTSCSGSFANNDDSSKRSVRQSHANYGDDDEAEENIGGDDDVLNQTYTHGRLASQLSDEDKFSRAIGKRVCISGEKYGYLRYFGPFHISVGLFCGVELDEEIGNHDGFIDGRRYFTALPLHGIFAPVEKVQIVADDVNVSDRRLADRLLKNSTVFQQQPSRSASNVLLGATNKMNVNFTDVRKVNNSVHLDETFDVADSRLDTAELPTFCRDALENAEFLETIEPHLMCHSMLDEENVAETGGQSGSLSQSFELSESLMFLKQSNFIGYDGSMSASQLAALIQSTEDNRGHKLSEEDVDVDAVALTNINEQDDIENLYFEEQTTPICGDVQFLNDLEANLSKNGVLYASTPFDESSSCNVPTSPANDVGIEKRKILGQVDSRSASNEDRVNYDDNFAATINGNTPPSLLPSSNVILRRTATPETNVGRFTERPISTVSADTGYQDDTEFETPSARSVSPPEHAEIDSNADVLPTADAALNVSAKHESSTFASDERRASSSTVVLDDNDRHMLSGGSSAESLVCETIYRDKSGNVVKVVRGENGVSKKENSQNNNKKATVEKTTSKRDSSKKINKTSSFTRSSPEQSPSKSKRHKADAAPALESSSSAYRKPLSAMKKETDKPSSDSSSTAAASATTEHVFVRPKLVKEVEPPPKKVRPPQKPSKSAEIMAKLQQSMAQEKAKPRREVKSRVFTALDSSKNEDNGLALPSRSQSRASSILTSAQISPNDCVAVPQLVGESAETSAAEPVSVNCDNNMVNGVVSGSKKVATKVASDSASKNVAKPPIKRDNSRDLGKHPPPVATNAVANNKRGVQVSKTTPLSGSSRFTKIAGQPVAASQQSTPNAASTKPSTASVSLKETEKKDQQLALANKRLVHAAKGFEAMCITIRHYVEQVIPALYSQLLAIKMELSVAKENSNALLLEKTLLSTENQRLLDSHSLAIADLKKHYDDNLTKSETAMKGDVERKLYDQANAHEEEIKKVIDEFRSKEKRLTKGYEKRQNDDTLQYQHKLAQLKEQQTSSVQDLKNSHTKEINDLTSQFEGVKSILETKLVDSQRLCERYKNEARQLEATLMKDTEKKMQHVNERFADYQKEIDSLRVVLEMKSAEIHDLRTKCQNLEKDLETLPLAKTRLAVLEQKNVELKEMLELRKQAERRLSQKHLELQHTHEREMERSQRLSMTNEQLQYRLQHLMMSQSAYETPMSRFAASESDTDSCIRNKPMSQSLIHIYAGTSPRTSKDLPVTVYTTEGISRALIFDQSDTDKKSSSASARQRKRASSEHKTNSSEEESSSASPSPQTTSRAKNVDKCSPTVAASNQRRISPLRRRNQSGTCLVGVPNVETVSELGECGIDGQCVDVTTAPPTDDNQSRRMCKSMSQQGQGYWTDSGVFTSSFHSELADQPLHNSVAPVVAMETGQATATEESVVVASTEK